MRRILVLFLAASLLAEENSSLLSANELGDFQGETSLGLLAEEKDSSLPTANLKRDGLYFCFPAKANRFFLPGLAFRRPLQNSSFLEVSYFNQKQGEIVLTRYKAFFEVESREKLGVIYQNILNASYGLIWNTRYIDPYICLGVGVCLPYVQYQGTSSLELFPAVSSALGLGFGSYGFLDLTITYLPVQWRSIFEYQEGGDKYTFKQNLRLLSDFRLGVGIPF